MALVGLAAAPSAFADDGLTGAVGQATSAVADPTPVTSAVAPVTAVATQPAAAATSAASSATATATNPSPTGPVAGAAATATQTAARAASPVVDTVRTAPQTVERIAQPAPRGGSTAGQKPTAPKSARRSGERAPSSTTGERATAALELGAPALGLPIGEAGLSGQTTAPDGSPTAQATTAANSGQSGPKRDFPWPSPVGSTSPVAAGAATALLLLMLFLFAEGLASAPPSFPRMLSLRRLLPASYPFLLELERPD